MPKMRFAALSVLGYEPISGYLFFCCFQRRKVAEIIARAMHLIYEHFHFKKVNSLKFI